MTGLNLETFLQLIRADYGTWASLGLIALILALMTWTSWGSRRALRKCLVLSIAAHVGLIVYGSSSPVVLRVLRLGASDRKPPATAARVRVTPWVESARKTTGPDGKPVRAVSMFDHDPAPLAMAEPARVIPPPFPSEAPSPSRSEPTPDSTDPAAPEVAAPAPPTVEAAPPIEKAPEPPPSVAPGDPSEVASGPVQAEAPPAREPSAVPGLPAEARPPGQVPPLEPGGASALAPAGRAGPVGPPPGCGPDPGRRSPPARAGQIPGRLPAGG